MTPAAGAEILSDSPDLVAYVPRFVAEWTSGATDERVRHVDGTMVFADISGFTKLSERLARLGKQGAEELTDLLNECFDAMIAAAGGFGGDVLKFGGDALLLLFTGADHAERACYACVAMRATLNAPRFSRSAGRVQLRMSQGVHSGTFTFFLVDGGHRELVITGPETTTVVECETVAAAEQIMLSHATAALVPALWLGSRRDEGRLLRLRTTPTRHVTAFFDARRLDLQDHLRSFVPEAQRQQIAAGVEGEHRPVTVAFVEFSGTDALSARDPGLLARRFQELATVVAEAASRFGVHWLATDVYHNGGKVILTAGAPLSTGDDEQAMLYAVREIMDAPLQLELRAGVNNGRVYAGNLGSTMRRTMTVMGDAVNLAARLMQQAVPGQIVASRSVLDASSSHFETVDLEPFLVKGKSAPIDAAVVGRLRQHAMDDTRLAFAPLPFVDREDELARLDTALAAALSHQPIAVEIVGDAGVGKTRLINEFAARHPELDRLDAMCGQYAKTTPYFAVRSLLRGVAGIAAGASDDVAGVELGRWVIDVAPRLMPLLPLIAIPFGAEVPSTPEADQVVAHFRRRRTNQLIVELLGNWVERPGLLVVDEAQWLDDASRDLVIELARAAPRSGWMVCVLRTDGAAGLPPESSAETIPLGPLSDTAILELVSAAAEPHVQLLARDVEALAARSGGHPLFAIELVEAAASQRAAGMLTSSEALPESVEKVIMSAIDTLRVNDRVLLRRAAILGGRVDLSLLAEVSGDVHDRDASRWRGLQRFVAFDREAGIVAFRHALFRQVAYEGLSFRERRSMHQRVGEVLEARLHAGVEVDAALLSVHFDRAAVNAKAWHYSRRAGDEAWAINANVEAAEFYQRALANAAGHDGAGPDARLEVHEALGDVAQLSARYDLAGEAFASARGLASHSRDLCRLFCKEGRLREQRGRYSDALRWFSRGYRFIADVGDPAEAARLRADLAIGKASCRFRQGRWSDVVLLAHETITAAELGGNRAALAHAYYLLDASLTTMGDARAVEYRGLALEIFEELGDLVGKANTLNNLGVAAYFMGRWDDSVELYEQSQESRHRAGDIVGAAMSRNNLAEVLSDQGHLERARVEFDACRRTWAGTGFSFGEAVVIGNQGRLEARCANFDRALELLDDSFERLEHLGAGNYSAEMRARRVECLLLAGSDAQALTEIEELIAATDPNGDPVFRSAVLRLQGVAHMRARRLERAAASLDQSIELAESSHAPFELAQSLAARAALRRLTGGDMAADEDRAHELFDQLSVAQRGGMFERAGLLGVG